MLRDGKPQLFCLAKTNLGYNQLSTNFEIARRKVLKDGERAEVLPLPFLRKAPKIVEAEHFVEQLSNQLLTIEAAALLYYWAKLGT